MNRRLKKLLLIGMILILICVAFYLIKIVFVKNIFDEMYFGSKDIFGGHLTSTSWRNMEGLAKVGDSVKYAVPGEIRIGFSNATLNDDENFQVVWETKKHRLVFSYSVSFMESTHSVGAILDISYSPYQKTLEVHPLRVASYQNIYGDTSNEAIDEFFRKCGSSVTDFYARFSDVFETTLIENWRVGNPTTLFQENLGEFEIVCGEGRN